MGYFKPTKLQQLPHPPTSVSVSKVLESMRVANAAIFLNFCGTTAYINLMFFHMPKLTTCFPKVYKSFTSFQMNQFSSGIPQQLVQQPGKNMLLRLVSDREGIPVAVQTIDLLRECDKQMFLAYFFILFSLRKAVKTTLVEFKDLEVLHVQ